MQINLSDSAQTGLVSGVRSMVVTALSTFVNPDVYGPDTFNQGQQTGLKLTITDGLANGSVIFGIGFQGSLYPDGTSTLGMSFLDGTTKGLTVNGHPYTVAVSGAGNVPGEVLATITPGSAPGPGGKGGSGNSGSGSGGSNSGSGSPGPTAPEPSGLVLASLGMSIAVYSCIRRRQTR
jgi:hypothetical protein